MLLSLLQRRQSIIAFVAVFAVIIVYYLKTQFRVSKALVVLVYTSKNTTFNTSKEHLKLTIITKNVAIFIKNQPLEAFVLLLLHFSFILRPN
jgi:hypothetical protein